MVKQQKREQKRQKKKKKKSNGHGKANNAEEEDLMKDTSDSEVQSACKCHETSKNKENCKVSSYFNCSDHRCSKLEASLPH